MEGVWEEGSKKEGVLYNVPNLMLFPGYLCSMYRLPQHYTIKIQDSQLD
jgi:hypothetical protein